MPPAPPPVELAGAVGRRCNSRVKYSMLVGAGDGADAGDGAGAGAALAFAGVFFTGFSGGGASVCDRL